VISGHIKCIKPRKEAFKYLLETYGLDPKECILIDDQEVNALGARKAGIHTILIKNGNFKQVRKELVELGILPKAK
jgi:putative hydrolase of the HAD superfamily